MTFFSECFNLKVTEKIVHPIIVFADNFKVLKNDSK